jgi:hypothetical protein
MNTKILLGALCAALVVCAAPRAQAQTNPPATAEPSGKPQWKKNGKQGGPDGRMGGLPPEEARRLGAAREKMKSADSPEARREAGKAMHEAMKAAMLKQNPDLGPLLQQLGPPPMGGPGGPGRPGGPDPMGPPPGMDDME